MMIFLLLLLQFLLLHILLLGWAKHEEDDDRGLSPACLPVHFFSVLTFRSVDGVMYGTTLTTRDYCDSRNT